MDASTSATEVKSKRTDLAFVWGLWLHQYDWDTFSTLTFVKTVNVGSAAARFTRWIQTLEQTYYRDLSWVYFAENGAAGRTHIHALVKGVAPFSEALLSDAWRSGISDHKAYDRARGAAFYIAKDVNSSRLVHYDVSSVPLVLLP